MNKMSDLLKTAFESFCESEEISKRVPPLGDTTLRNPLIKRVFNILNHLEEDHTGHCHGMQREMRELSFHPGSLDPHKWLGGVLLNAPTELSPVAADRVHLWLNKTLLLTQQFLAPLFNPALDTGQKFPPVVLKYLRLSDLLTKAVTQTACKDFSSRKAVKIVLCEHYSMSVGFYTAELAFKAERCIVPRDFLLMASDLVSGRANVLLFSYFTYLCYQEFPLSVATLESIFLRGDRVLVALGNDTYYRIKLLEPYCMSLLLQWSGQNLIPSTFETFIKEETAQFEDAASAEFFDTIAEYGNSPKALANLFGLFRLWGHPILDTDMSRDKIIKIATKRKSPKPSAVSFMTAAFKKWTILGYIKKHGIWPNVDMSSLPDDCELTRAQTHNVFPNLYSEALRLDHWESIKGKKTFDLPISLNTATLLSDKSHSLNLKALEQAVRETRRPGTSDMRRVLLTALRTELPSVKEIVDQYSSSTLPADHLVIGLREKEREVSPYARMFGLMSLPMRMYFVLTEQMLAHDFLPLFPESTMKDDLLSLKKKKENIVRHMRPSTGPFIIVILNLDFEKWNLNMRYEITQGPFQFVDELYSTDLLFQNSHKVFEHSIMYLAHGVHPIDIDGHLGGPNVWRGHLGGIEGLRQKGWTLITIAAIKELAAQNHLSCFFMAQGDNQVVAVRLNLVDKSEISIAKAKNQFLKFRAELLSLFSDLELPLKGSETWSSSEVFAYGKDLFFKGVKLGLVLKRAARCHYLVNEGFPSFYDYVSSIGSAISTLNEETTSILVPWILYVWNLLILCKDLAHFHPLLRRGVSTMAVSDIPRSAKVAKQEPYKPRSLSSLFSNQPLALLSAILSAKSPVHGFPTITPLDLLCHGFPDALTMSLSWTKMLVESSRFSQPVPKSHWDPILDKTPNPLQLCEDPCSLPLLMPPSVANRVKVEVTEYLRNPQNVRNRKLGRFFSISTSRQDRLAAVLFRMTPCNPKLMSDILQATPIGQATAIINQVSSTTTINRLIYSTYGDSITTLLQRSEMQLLGYLSWLWSRGTLSTTSTTGQCPTEKARELRCQGWGKTILITVPHPLHFLSEVPVSNQSSSVITVRLSGATGRDLREKIGPFPSYAGSITKEKLPGLAALRASNIGPLIRRPLALCRMIGWICDKDSILAATIRAVLSASSDVPPEILGYEDLEVTGSAEHRYSDARTDHVTNVAGDGLATTHIHVGVASWTEYCKGGKNQTLHFQSILGCLGRIYYEKALSLTPPASLTWLKNTCPHCIQPTYEGRYDLATTIVPEIPSFPDVDTLFLHASELTALRPLSIQTDGASKDQASWASVSYSLGVSAFYYATQINVSMTQHVLALEALQGYSDAWLTSLLFRYLRNRLNSSTLPDFNRFSKFAIIQALTTKSDQFSSIELLFQYTASRTQIAAVLGSYALPADTPMGSSARRKAAKGVCIYLLNARLKKASLCVTHNTLELEAGAIQYDSRFYLSVYSCAIARLLSQLESNDPKLSRAVVYPHQVLTQTVNERLSVRDYTAILQKAIGWDDFVEICLNNATYSWLLKNLAQRCVPIIPQVTTPFPVIPHTTINRDYHVIRHRVAVRLANPRLDEAAEELIPHDYTNLGYFLMPIPTSAWYKWVSVLHDIGAPLHRPACLADGAGGVARACYDLSSPRPSDRQVFFSTRPFGPDSDQYSLEDLTPPALIGLPNVSGLDLLSQGIGDLTNEAEVKVLVDRLRQFSPTVITCDAETQGWYGKQTVALTDAIITIATSFPNVLTIMKSYTNPSETISWILTVMRHRGLTVQVRLSPLSPRSSSECFLILSNTTENHDKETVEWTTTAPVKSEAATIRSLVDSLSAWRTGTNMIPLYSPQIKYGIKYNLTAPVTLTHLFQQVRNYYEGRLISLKLFPDLGKHQTGPPVLLSSNTISALWISHVILETLPSLEQMYPLICNHAPGLHVYQTSGNEWRLHTSLYAPNTAKKSIRIQVKKDVVFDKVLRHAFSLRGFFSL